MDDLSITTCIIDDYETAFSRGLNYFLILLILGNAAAVLLESVNDIRSGQTADGRGVDQITRLIEGIKRNPDSGATL